MRKTPKKLELVTEEYKPYIPDKDYILTYDAYEALYWLEQGYKVTKQTIYVCKKD